MKLFDCQYAKDDMSGCMSDKHCMFYHGICSGPLNLGECTLWHNYLNRYKKNVGLMRRYSSSSVDCAINENEVNFIDSYEFSSGERCIYNVNSFLNKQIRNYKNRIILAEGLIRTYPSKKLKKYVFERLQQKLQPWQVNCDLSDSVQQVNLIKYFYTEDGYNSDNEDTQCAGNVQLAIPILAQTITANGGKKKTLDDLVDLVIRPFQLFGYDSMSADFARCQFDVVYNGQKIKDVVLAVLVFEAKYQMNEFKANRFMYHLTLACNTQEILKYGLMPKSSSKIFKYMHRVYLFNTFKLKQILKYASESTKENHDQHGNVNNMWTMFQIDTKKIPDLKLYADTNRDDYDRDHPFAVFIYGRIPKEAIVRSKTFDMDKYAEDI